MKPTVDRLEWRGLALACMVAIPLWAIIIGVVALACGWRP